MKGKNKMKTTRKLLLALVLVMSILMTLAVAVIPASAASTGSDGTTYIYADVESWDPGSARFAAYFFGSSGNTWVSMTHHSGNIYKVAVPAGTWSNVIFCRMNKNTTDNNWDNKWNQTKDLTITNANNNCYYKVNTSSGWNDSDDNQWKGHTPGVAATCTTAQTCTVCTKVITAALNHNTDGVVTALCSACWITPCVTPVAIRQLTVTFVC